MKDIGRVGVGGRLDPFETDGVVTTDIDIGAALVVVDVEVDTGGFPEEDGTAVVDALLTLDSIKATRSIFREEDVN